MFTLPDMLVKIRYVSVVVSTNESKTAEEVIKIPVSEFNPNKPFRREFLRLIQRAMEERSSQDVKCFAYHLEYAGI